MTQRIYLDLALSNIMQTSEWMIDLKVKKNYTYNCIK